MNEIVRCLYCGGDWDTHDANSRRFCNRRKNEVAKIASTVKHRDGDLESFVSVKTPWKNNVEAIRQFNYKELREWVDNNTESPES